MTKQDSTSHLSIGEVLSLLQDEFPDVTISKIRFLESQGLIDPERTPSGYRKFYEVDIYRLEWVLRQQRDHFLPLKVIKAKLESGEDLNDDSQQSLFSSSSSSEASANADSPNQAAGPSSKAPEGAGSSNQPADKASPKVVESPVGETAESGAVTTVMAAVSVEGVAGGDNSGDPPDAQSKDPGAWLAALQEGGNAPPEDSQPATGDGVDERMSAEELARLADVSAEVIADLVEYSLLVPIYVGGEEMFDSSCVDVVKATREFFDQGVSARHLRIFKNAADREAGFHEQLILPLLKQRNPKARSAAVARLKRLSKAGTSLHKALVAQALRSHLGG